MTARRASIGVSRAALKDHAAWGTEGRYPLRGESNPKLANRDHNGRNGGRRGSRRADLDVPDPLLLAARAATSDAFHDTLAGLADDVRGVAQAGREEALRDDLDRGSRGRQRLRDRRVDPALNGAVRPEQRRLDRHPPVCRGQVLEPVARVEAALERDHEVLLEAAHRG